MTNLNESSCDSKEPVWLSNSATIEDRNLLPVSAVRYGPHKYEVYKANITIGPLQCHSAAEEERFNAKVEFEDLEVKVSEIVLNLEQNAGTDQDLIQRVAILENSQEIDTIPVGTITAWTPKNAMDSKVNIDLPDGWLSCDGQSIENGPWAGRVTPDLNTNGHFLRGGLEANVMEFEEDQMQDHEHTDSGHSHSSRPHTHPYKDASLYRGGSNIFDTVRLGGSIKQSDNARVTDAASVTIKSAKSNIGRVSSSYRRGVETRPRNMKVIWVMKCW